MNTQPCVEHAHAHPCAQIARRACLQVNRADLTTHLHDHRREREPCQRKGVDFSWGYKAPSTGSARTREVSPNEGSRQHPGQQRHGGVAERMHGEREDERQNARGRSQDHMGHAHLEGEATRNAWPEETNEERSRPSHAIRKRYILPLRLGSSFRGHWITDAQEHHESDVASPAHQEHRHAHASRIRAGAACAIGAGREREGLRATIPERTWTGIEFCRNSRGDPRRT